MLNGSLKDILEALKFALLKLQELLKRPQADWEKNFDTSPEIKPEDRPMNQDPVPAPKYLWETPEKARHSVRVICDEEGLTVEQKNTLCSTVGAESGWKPHAVGKPNSNGSRDWGICQINDALWIGKGHGFPTTDYVLENPEKCIRWMCYWWKKGKRNWWIAYANGSYQNYA